MGGLERKYIWGVDLALKQTGFAVSPIDKLEPIYITTINTSHIKDSDDPERLLRLEYIARELCVLQKNFPPVVVCVERAFVDSNKKNTAQALSEVHGLFKGLMGMFGNREFIYYAPLTIKAQVLQGKASKELIQQKLIQEFPGIKFRNDNESDAWATIVTYFIKSGKVEWKKHLKIDSSNQKNNKKIRSGRNEQ